jgi:hypothetical protein
MPHEQPVCEPPPGVEPQASDCGRPIVAWVSSIDREDVRVLLARMLEGATSEGAVELREQISRTNVTGGIPSMLDLEVDPSAPCGDGPIPVRAVVEEPDGTPVGFVLVWAAGGYLAGLESAWVTDEPPQGLFPPDRLRIEQG